MTVNCASCGKPGLSGNRFCIHCGAPLQFPAPPPPRLGELAVPWLARLVPATGLDAHSSPDPASPVTRLPGDSRVIVRRRAGAWALVWCESGWMGWVDEACLVDPDAPAAAARAPSR